MSQKDNKRFVKINLLRKIGKEDDRVFILSERVPTRDRESL